MVSKVALVRCTSYKKDAVEKAISRGLELLGGIKQFAAEGEQILLKPNILTGEAPEKCIGPHPQVFRAVAKEFKETGAELSYGDSPGFGNPRANAKRAGFMEPAAEIGVTWADFSTAREMPFPDGHMVKKFQIAEGVAASDGIINISKLKTHALTRITGAIKNTFGCIPGARKAEYHSVLPTATLFSKMLVDLNRLLHPRLFIMDGIRAMEGNGPRNGDPRQMNVLLFSDDPVALDATVCRMINLDPGLVETVRYGEEFGLGTASDIKYVGEKIETFDSPDFLVNRRPAKTTTGTSFLSTNFMRRYSAPRPTIDAEKCTRCGQCVKVCPAEPKALSWTEAGKDAPPEYDYSKCIRCYCCQEMCPFEAIDVKVPWLGKFIRQ